MSIPKYDPPWSQVRDGLVKQLIEKHRDDLERQDDPAIAAEIRGSIKALRNLDKAVHPDLGDPGLSNDIYHTDQ